MALILKTYHISKDDDKKLKQLAKQENTTKAGLVREAISRLIKAIEKRKPTEK